MKLLIGFLSLLSFFAYNCVQLNIEVASLISLYSLLVIIFACLLYLFISGNNRIFFGYLKKDFRKKPVYEKIELDNISSALGGLIKVSLGTGALVFIFCLISILYRLDDPASIGPNLAVSLLTVIYSISISLFVFFPTKAWADKNSK